MRTPFVLCLFLVACGTTYEVPVVQPGSDVTTQAPSRTGGGRSSTDFRQVVARVEPAAEAFCREEAAGAPPTYCDFRIVLETDPRMPPNAFQTRGRDGRPLVVVGAGLLDEMQSNDEIAFVLSHEMSHHIAGHIDKQQQQQALGALIFGGLAAAGGNPYGGPASEQAIQQAMDLGAFVGARAYAQSYELEADTLGAYVTARAGYDPQRGADVFGRPSLENPGGPPLLASHPGSAQRQATVARVAAEIRRQQAAGLVPRPDYAGRV